MHEAAALASLSVVYRDLGSLKESVRCGKEALELLRSLEDTRTEAYVLTSLAESYSRLGHTQRPVLPQALPAVAPGGRRPGGRDRSPPRPGKYL